MARTKNTDPRKKNYRVANHESGVRMAHLVDWMPRSYLGQELARVTDELGCSSQTVRRYIKALNNEFVTTSGDPQFVIERRGELEYLVRRPDDEAHSGLHIYHLVSTYLSLEFFKMLGANNLFVDLVNRVFAEVEKKVPSEHRRLMTGLPLKFYSAPFAPKDYSGHTDQLEDVIKALIYQRMLRLKYKKLGCRPENYTVSPLTLLLHKGGLYLIALSDKHEQPVYFNIERMRSVEVLQETFEYPANYHPDQMLDGAFGIFTGPAKTFRLKFAPALKDYIKSRTWHKSQKIRALKNGSIILTLEVADSEEVRGWIRGFGEEVEVVE